MDSSEIKKALGPQQREDSLIGIIWLPNELLAEIISLYVAASSLEDVDDCGFSVDPYRWIRITHVCHLWREIALHTPSFWVHVFFAADVHLHAIPKMLARADSLPLSLEMRSTDRPSQAFDAAMQIVSQHIPKAISLRLQIPILSLRKTVDDLRSLCAPLLHSIVLYNSSKHGSLPHFFQYAWDFPSLRELTLSGFSLGWTSPLMRHRQLTKLVVTCPGVLRSIHDVSPTLREMSELRYLQLCLPLVHDVPGPLTDSVERDFKLPHLTFLHLAMASYDIVYLLQLLAVPNTTVMVLQANTMGRLNQLSQHIAEHFNGSTGTPPISIRGSSILQRHPTPPSSGSTNYSVYDDLVLDFYTAPIVIHDHLRTWQPPLPGASPNNQPQIRFSFPVSIVSGLGIRFLSDYLAQFSLADVETVLLSTGLLGSFEEIFRNLPSVSTMVFADKTQTQQQKPDVLDVFRAQAVNDGPTMWLVPRLDTLILHNISRPSSSWITFADAIYARTQSGFSIRRVDIQCAGGLTAEDVRIMRERLDCVGSLYLSEIIFQPSEVCTAFDPSPFKDNLMQVLVDRARAGAYIQRVVLSGCAGLWEQHIEDMRKTMNHADWILE
ncbi:hypothetical protein EIP91_005470 [Steccherinum ochraceum]|uniref:Uncharacterized protein n=1 Tax=Steccherinum ochraceum TaxID=92696 RepID=A0A4R0S448_9APHY|nr:hypothetical protein EIP91_005470 [Steccherinum ochraceum]